MAFEQAEALRVGWPPPICLWRSKSCWKTREWCDGAPAGTGQVQVQVVKAAMLSC